MYVLRCYSVADHTVEPILGVDYHQNGETSQSFPTDSMESGAGTAGKQWYDWLII